MIQCEQNENATERKITYSSLWQIIIAFGSTTKNFIETSTQFLAKMSVNIHFFTAFLSALQ